MTVAGQEYHIPFAFGEAEFVEKRSRFIGRVWPSGTEAEALVCIAAMREKHYDASHNVFAYSVRTGQTRYSDDGEPRGTSGLPVLGVLRNEGVHNFCCVVTRYYGGLQLGAGGLVRAYSRAAKLALEAAGISLMRQWDILLIPCPYALFERVKALVTNYGGGIESSEFAADVLIQALLPVERTASCVRAVQDISSGTVEAVTVDTVFRGVRIR